MIPRFIDMARGRQLRNPLNDKFERPLLLPDYFAPGVDGIKFSDGTIYNPVFTRFKLK